MAPHREDLLSAESNQAGASKKFPAAAIVGVVAAGFAFVIILSWIVFMVYRERTRKKREDARSAEFLTVRGVVRESLFISRPIPVSVTIESSVSDHGPNASVEKSIFEPNTSNEEVLSYYEQQGKVPRPFAPFSFALNASSTANNSSPISPPSPSAMSNNSKAGATLGSMSVRAENLNSASPQVDTHYRASAQSLHSRARSSVFSALRDSFRDSFLGLYGYNAGSTTTQRPVSWWSIGVGLGNKRGSNLTGAGARLSSASAFSRGSSVATGSVVGSGVQMRRVRQLYTPILPDEPHLTLGERVAIMRSFDDGWCVIGRDQPSRAGTEVEVELGTVPAWCFVKPLKGLRSERPVRSSSLGVTVQMDAEWDGPEKKRSDIISWSNF